MAHLSHTSCHGVEDLKPLLVQNIPIVIWRSRPAPEEELVLDTIFVDNAAMAKTSVTYLIEQGHRRIGMISGLENTPPHRNRIQGFCNALSEHGLPVDDVLIQGGDFTEKAGYEGILAQPPMEFDVAGSVFKNRQGIEIDFLLASQKANRVHAYEIKRGMVNRGAELNRLIGKAARLTFKSIKLHNPQITGEVLNLGDM